MNRDNKRPMKDAVKRILSIALILLMTAAFVLPAEITDTYAADPTNEKVERILSQMTLEEKITQMMVVALPSKNAAIIQKEYQFGGYILFGRDFKRTNKKGMKNLMASCQRSSMAAISSRVTTMVW